MPINDQEKQKILGLAEVERLQWEGMVAIEREGDANAIADKLLSIRQQTSDTLVAEMAMLAHAGIASGQLAAAAAALASVHDQIATATNTFNLAARIAQEGKANLTFPFIAGKAASLLDLLKTLEKTVKDTIDNVGNIEGVDDLVTTFQTAKTSVEELKQKAEGIAVVRRRRPRV
jgi:hypothetical protein